MLLSDDEGAVPSHHVIAYLSPVAVAAVCDSASSSDELYTRYYASRRLSIGEDIPDRVFVSTWFSGPSTWQMTTWPQIERLWDAKGIHVKRLVTIIYRWYLQWLHTSGNPFIHKQFYRHRLPRCAQDACSTLAVYLQRTPQNTSTILRLIDSRATQLLADNGVFLPDESQSDVGLVGSGTDTSNQMDTHDHIARIHALTLYQLLGLYSPDPRLRRRAEDRAPILVTWMQQLIAHAQHAIPFLGESLYKDAAKGSRASSAYQDDELWHAWILAESARRAFMIGTTVQALYLRLREGDAASADARHELFGTRCQGGMPFTTRKGAWDATHSAQWASLAVEVDFELTHVQDAKDRLGKRGDTEEWNVDVFAETFIRGTYGHIL